MNFSDLPAKLAAIAPSIEHAIRNGVGFLFVGAPGTTATMIARRLPGLFPDLTREQTEILSGIQRSYYKQPDREPPTERPLRAPHHSARAAVMSGHLHRDYPGEVEMASFGVLYLDDLPDFSIETIKATARTITERDDLGPVLIAASACPCPCGMTGVPREWCSCTKGMIDRHMEHLGRYTTQLGLVQIELPYVTMADLNRRGGIDNTEIVRRRLWGVA